MHTQTITVRTADVADTEPLAATLAEAFQSDPVLSWCYPDGVERARILPTAFRVILQAAVAHGRVETALDGVAASVWIPPTAELDEERMLADLGTVSGHYASRLFTLMGLLDQHHPTREHEYLFLLGTRDAWQSRGLGTALLRSVLDACDRDGVPAYLEATSQRNRSLYERHGFEVTETVRLPDGGPPLWCMWREPA